MSSCEGSSTSGGPPLIRGYPATKTWPRDDTIKVEIRGTPQMKPLACTWSWTQGAGSFPSSWSRPGSRGTTGSTPTRKASSAHCCDALRSSNATAALVACVAWERASSTSIRLHEHMLSRRIWFDTDGTLTMCRVSSLSGPPIATASSAHNSPLMSLRRSRLRLSVKLQLWPKGAPNEFFPLRPPDDFLFVVLRDATTYVSTFIA
mmetsp:Transcript_15793/g.46793  ORF Transcript_15793/g.46793 Transcript_15793/m.46793 type:complete len:205 (+) Transcript_15793:3044-3658(+)